MPRLTPLDPELAAGAAKALLEATQAQLGRTPNLYRCMAHSPAVLKGYLDFRAALGTGLLKTRMREQLALLVAEENTCGYCVSAHTFRGKKMGILPEELELNRNGASADVRTAAGLRFAQVVTRNRGAVSDEQFEAVRAAGWSDPEIAEILGHVALNSFSNVFSQVAQPELDFPKVALLSHV